MERKVEYRGKNRSIIHKIFLVIVISTLIGTTFGLYFFLSGISKDFRTIVTSILYSVIIGTLMMLIIYHRVQITGFIELQYLRFMVVVVLLGFVAIVGTELTRIIQSQFLFRKEYIPFGGSSLYFLNIIIVLITGIPIYEREEWKSRTLERLEKKEFELLKMEQLKTLSDLETLRAKIQPHFLYNVHNTIANLIRTNPDQAEKMIISLSRFFRFALGKENKSFHSIGEEMEIIETYLELQKIRFDYRLKTNFEIDPHLIKENIPSFLLQPLVENIFKHSFDETSQLFKISVRIFRKDTSLFMQVEDNGPPFPEEVCYGYGWQSIINKLNLLYLKRYNFSAQNRPFKQVQIILFQVYE